MKITAEKNGTMLLIALEGRMDTTTAPEAERAINGQLEGVNQLVLDMKALRYISSAGLRVLLGSQKKMIAAGGTMVVKHVNELIMEIFETTGFTEILTIENDA